MNMSTTAVRAADPCTLVIFGASGDLTHRLLIPALYNLAAGSLLSDTLAIIGVSRKELSHDAFRDELKKSLGEFATRKVDDAYGKSLLSNVSFVRGDVDDAGTYERLRVELERVERAQQTHGNRLFYVATPPSAFVPIASRLGQAGLAKEDNGAWRRIIIEKPFGTDLASARALNSKLLEVFDEQQIYRIDHYLGKETGQNIMALRFGNAIFEPIWNRYHIDHIAITATETVGVEKRGKSYDSIGALRDMVPNHMF